MNTPVYRCAMCCAEFARLKHTPLANPPEGEKWDKGWNTCPVSEPSPAPPILLMHVTAALKWFSNYSNCQSVGTVSRWKTFSKKGDREGEEGWREGRGRGERRRGWRYDMNSEWLKMLSGIQHHQERKEKRIALERWFHLNSQWFKNNAHKQLNSKLFANTYQHPSINEIFRYVSINKCNRSKWSLVN